MTLLLQCRVREAVGELPQAAAAVERKDHSLIEKPPVQVACIAKATSAHSSQSTESKARNNVQPTPNTAFLLINPLDGGNACKIPSSFGFAAWTANGHGEKHGLACDNFCSCKSWAECSQLETRYPQPIHRFTDIRSHAASFGSDTEVTWLRRRSGSQFPHYSDLPGAAPLTRTLTRISRQRRALLSTRK